MPHHCFPPSRLTLIVSGLLLASLGTMSHAQEGMKAVAETLQLRADGRLSDELMKGKAAESGPIFLRAQTVSGVLDDVVTAEGQAELRRLGLSIKADVLRYESVTDQANAKGNVRLFREGNLYTGPELTITTETGAGIFALPSYTLAKTGGGGTASRIAFLDKRRSVAYDMNYSTCPRDDMAWQLTADEVKLDFDEEEGEGKGVKLAFKGVPLIVAPSLSFPLSDKRRSGFLPPQLDLSNTSGFSYAQPYYWDIAPNRDLTFTPVLISKRGVQLNNEFRYLGATYRGQAEVDWLPRDALYNQDKRWATGLQHTGLVAGTLSYGLNAARVSDNNYWRDFQNNNISGLTTRQLPADLNASYAIPYGYLSSRAVRYQTLHSTDAITADVGEPYDVMPQIGGHWERYAYKGLDFSLDTQWSRFRHRTLISGERFVLAPSISYPIQSSGYFVIPKLNLRQLSYRTDSLMSDGRSSASISIPTLSVDTGLIFERNAQFFGSKFIQTLEPRAFFVETPYRNQAALPIFDSGPLDFSFPAIYSDNAFSGYDRVSDDRTLTLGLSSRLLDEATGAERLRVQFAQRVRFRDQLVTSSNVPNSERLSDALFGVTFLPNDKYAFDTTVQYNPDTKRSVRSVFGARYTPEPYKTLAFSYSLNRILNTEQFGTAWQWPLAFAGLPHVYTVGKVSYSREERRVTDAVLGMEWERACWLFRLVAQRTSLDIKTASTRFYLQLELKGLTRLGTNPLSTLMSNIPQYKILGQPSERPSPYSNYE